MQSGGSRPSFACPPWSKQHFLTLVGATRRTHVAKAMGIPKAPQLLFAGCVVALESFLIVDFFPQFMKLH